MISRRFCTIRGVLIFKKDYEVSIHVHKTMEIHVLILYINYIYPWFVSLIACIYLIGTFLF